MNLIEYIKGMPRKLKIFLYVVSSIFFLFILLNFIFPLRIDIEYSTIILDKKGNLVHSFLTEDDKWRMFTELDEITPELKEAIIYKEDKYFYYHPGINPVSVIRAIIKNTIKGKRTSGASTITMQVARMLNPKERTYGNKIKEIFRALQLEMKYSKDEILQLYLNLVPFGSNIEGVKSASVIYLGKLPNHLSIGEIAALSIIPNRPVSLRLGLNNISITVERNKWLNRYKKAKLFDTTYINDALQEPLNAYRREVPKKAPHLSYRLKSSFPGKKIIRTTLDPSFQYKAENIVGQYSKRLYFQDIKNAIALIVDNETHNVLAYVGSADFFNNEDGGQVDGIRAVRSPGSTLKPLLYGLAMDEGLITPKTVIADVRVSFDGYEPENYDNEFHGQITIENALATSLNIPAVKVLAMLNTGSMIEKLSSAGFIQIKNDRNDLGLSLILGGCGVTLEEMSGLYCSLANQGLYEPLNYTNQIRSDYEYRLLSEGSSFMITEILTLLTRPDLPIQWANSVHMPKIAWKTGTSYGRRDAWSIGFNNNYTIGVWVGNFSGEGVPELNGAEMATPLLFQLFNAIDYDSKKEWYAMPNDLGLRYVCAETGKRPGEYCDNQIMDYYIPGVTDNTVCNHLKKIHVNPDTTISYCTSCLPELGYKTMLFPDLEPEIITFYEENNINYLKIPPHNTACERLLTGKGPQITSPVNENEYYVNILDSAQIKLSCHVANDVEKVYWYVNKKFFRSANPGQDLFFKPDKGKVEISCSDDKGRNSDIVIYVKYARF